MICQVPCPSKSGGWKRGLAASTDFQQNVVNCIALPCQLISLWCEQFNGRWRSILSERLQPKPFPDMSEQMPRQHIATCANVSAYRNRCECISSLVRTYLVTGHLFLSCFFVLVPNSSGIPDPRLPYSKCKERSDSFFREQRLPLSVENVQTCWINLQHLSYSHCFLISICV